MEPKDNEHISLEEILWEFSDHPDPEPPRPAPEQPEVVTGDTIRLDRIQQAVSGDTVRLDQIQQAVAAEKPDPDATTVFRPVTLGTREQGSDTIVLPILDEPEVEPFSDAWEPEYEEPMGDYPAPKPIPFRPRTRLRELRQKLVAGPEQRYYALSELGIGKLQAAIFLSVLIFLVSAGATALFSWGVIPDHRLRAMVFGQLLGMLLTALLGCYRLLNGVADLFRLRFTMNTMLVFTFLICLADGVLCLKEQRIPCCAVFSLEMTMAMWAECQRRGTEMGQMDTLRRATELEALVRLPDYYEGRTGYVSAQGEVEDFMDHYNAPSKPEKILSRYALAALAVSLGIGLLGGVRHGFSLGVQVCAGAMLVSMPAAGFVALSRPAAILEKRLHKLGTVLCGWHGIQAVERQSAYPLEDQDLFPGGAVKLNGMKFYGDRDPDTVVAWAATLVKENGGGLEPLFAQLMDSRGLRYCRVENLRRYGSGGIGGEIGGEPVLVGTLQFLRDMGVDVGSGTRVHQALYCAIGGEMCGVFAVSYGKSKAAAAGLRTLTDCRGLTPVLLTRDCMVTESFLRSKFAVNTRRMAFPEGQIQKELREKQPQPDRVAVALTTRGGLASRAFALTGAKALGSAMKAGTAVHMAGGILGLVILALLAYIGAADLVTPSNLLLYQLIWMLPALLITEWTRSI